VPVAVARELIGAGGPLRRLEGRCHLTSLSSQIAVALAIAWLPIILFAVATEHYTGFPVRLLHDPAMHVRFVVATPLLLFLDRVFPIACSSVIDVISSAGFIRDPDRPRFDRLLASVRRLAEWTLPELLLAVLALALGAATLIVGMPFGGVRLRIGLTAADWWYALVALPLFEFLLFRSVWRWAIWVRALYGLSRFDLDLDATHPDCRGGIAFLRRPSLAYCALLLSAASAVLSAAWADRFSLVTTASFIPLLLVLALIAMVLAFGPLLLFAFQLHQLRWNAQDTLGGLAARNGRWFRGRWIDSAAGEVVTSAEVQSLAALAATYRDTVKQLRLTLFEKKDLLLVLLATLLPVVPNMLLRVPHDEWRAMVSFLFGKALPL
jgi:hypothetical protein